MEEPVPDNEEKYFEESEDRQKKLKEKIFEWCQKGDAAHLRKYINDQMVNIEDKDATGWTPLIWASVNCQAEIVRIILDKLYGLYSKQGNDSMIEDEQAEGNTQPSKSNQQTILIEEKSLEENFKKPPSSIHCKYNPLHWAAYKGSILISSLLLKAGFNPLDIDMYGNSSLHQASASNSSELFKMFMGVGLDLEVKNARNHTPLDMTSNDEIKQLIRKAVEAKKCPICNKYFDFYRTKYLCNVKEEIVCKDCCISNTYFLNEKENKKEIIECKCKNCYEALEKEEKSLEDALGKNDLSILEATFDKCKDTKMNPKLRQKVLENIDRLRREKTIKEIIQSLENVENHKTIEKSVFLLQEQIDLAKANKINIDYEIGEWVEKTKLRKIAEKELRKLLSNITVFDSSEAVKKEIEEKLSTAAETKVDHKFIEEATNLLAKVNLHLDCMDVFTKLITYPPREYKPVEPLDKKKKKPEPPKKKKKKEPPFPTPEWAKTSKDVKEKVDIYVKYLKMGAEIGLNEEFAVKSKEVLARFKLEIDHRKREEEELRLLEEEKAKKNKKKK